MIGRMIAAIIFFLIPSISYSDDWKVNEHFPWIDPEGNEIIVSAVYINHEDNQFQFLYDSERKKWFSNFIIETNSIIGKTKFSFFIFDNFQWKGGGALLYGIDPSIFSIGNSRWSVVSALADEEINLIRKYASFTVGADYSVHEKNGAHKYDSGYKFSGNGLEAALNEISKASRSSAILKTEIQERISVKNGSVLECSVSEIAKRFRQPDITPNSQTVSESDAWVSTGDGFEAGLSVGSFLIIVNWFGNSKFPYSEKNIALDLKTYNDASLHTYMFVSKLLDECFLDDEFSEQQKMDLEFFFQKRKRRHEFKSKNFDVSILRQVGFDQSILDLKGGSYLGGAIFFFK